MGFMNMLGGLLQQYSASQGQPEGDVHEHFEQVAASVPASALAGGIADAFRSGETPPFAQMAAQLFSSGGDHQSSMLNGLISSAGPGMLQQFLGQNSGSALAGLLGGGGGQLTPEQAATIPPEEVQALAQHVEKHDPSIMDRMGEIYANHPTAIKALGATAAIIALRSIARRTA